MTRYELAREAFVVNGIDFAGRMDIPASAAYNPHYPHVNGVSTELPS